MMRRGDNSPDYEGKSTKKYLTGSYASTSGNCKIKIISNTGALEVALPSGILLLVIIIVAIGCVTRKRRDRHEKRLEVMKADEDPVYGDYQLSSTINHFIYHTL